MYPDRMSGNVGEVWPLAKVASVDRTVAFYQLFGFTVINVAKTPAGETYFAGLRCGPTGLMFARAGKPLDPEQQGVLFYLYSPDLAALREHLMEKGVAVSEITYPEYMQGGEFQAQDPDGYTLLIGRSG
jgi:predicted enzyme related to lactoylglutathione lyase